MPNRIVSAHGGRWDDEHEDYTVPDGSEVVYYVADGGILSNDDGYRILAELQAGREPGGHVVERVGEGEDTFDYSCWYAPEFADHCGIFTVGDPNRTRSLEHYDEHNPAHLSDVFGWYPNCTIYWVACREISHRATDDRLGVSEGSFLTAAES
jgi:hypothetical protein